MNKGFDHIVIGAGIYGLYIARRLALAYPQRKIAILEYDEAPFLRASYINQARVHNGYHYPRSLSTALKSAKYYERFVKDYGFAINKKFEKIYAISSDFSYASSDNFKQFCEAANIPCNEIHHSKYFKSGVVESCFLTEEHSMDAKIISEYFISELSRLDNVEQIYGVRIKEVKQTSDHYIIIDDNGSQYSSSFVINTTYASVNQVLDLFGFEKFKIKYEIAEICLCDVTDNILEAGLTVMDGPFFSLMPFGLSGYHSLSAVHFTPHKTSYDTFPTFDCQRHNPACTPQRLENCNTCPARPQKAWNEMRQLARKYLRDDIDMTYQQSLFAIKPILTMSEISDSRPTIIKEFSDSPKFISVLSGKFNTMYDLEEVLTW